MSLKGFAKVIQEYAVHRHNEQIGLLKTGLETPRSCVCAGMAQAYEALAKDAPILLANYESSLLDQGIDPADHVEPESPAA